MGLITTGGGVGEGIGLGIGPLTGPPGVGVGAGEGITLGGAYAAFGNHHSWNPAPSTAGARKAMPLPSGAHVGCATNWLLITVLRGPRFVPFHDAKVRYDTCVL